AYEIHERLVGSEMCIVYRVIIFGIGGVGSWVAECLIRTGVIHLTLVDSDTISLTNVNRQMPATSSTIGEIKTEATKRRLLDINPQADIKTLTLFYGHATASQIDLTDYDYVVDAIDSLKDKALLIINATRSGRKIYSSMGAALKMDPQKIKVAEFWDVKGCPLARALRNKFKKEKIFPSKKFLCVYSEELLENRGKTNESCEYKVQVNGSLCHITAIFGMTLAGEIIKDIVSL
ncbi:MAG: tRNA threonylcarbamoyladenosine dehydratase, partial [Muribaculaceae bacterium]|nr:tRNA threonylcarbamoyladenosine dehydratase [Muribaculaceae bacterium]